MEHDPQTVLVLLALRQLGGQSVPAKQELFTKGLKQELQTAIDRELVKKVAFQATGAKGKPKKGTVDVLSLTAAGEELLRQMADPEVLAATAAAQLAAKSNTQLAEWKTRLEQDRQALHKEMSAATKGASKPATVSSKEYAALAKTVHDLATKLEKIEKQLDKNTQESPSAKIDEVYERLLATADKIAQAIPAAATSASMAAPHQTPSHAAAAPHPTPARAHETQTQPPQSTASIADVLFQAYKDQCLDVEHTDGVVPLPRLYHQAHAALPGLTVEAFHQQLEKLWDEHHLDLMVLNEVRRATEPDKAIRRGDNLYYFVKWRNQ